MTARTPRLARPAPEELPRRTRARKLEQNAYVTLQIDRHRQARPARRHKSGENRSCLRLPCTIRCAHRGKFSLQRPTLNVQRLNMLRFVITAYRAEIMVNGAVGE